MWQDTGADIVRLGAVAALALAAAGAPRGQAAHVVPPTCAAVEGSGSTNLPFGRLGPYRVQMAYEGTLFSGPVAVSRLGLRADGGLVAAAKTVELEVTLATMPSGIAAMQSGFALNRGADAVLVFGKKSVRLPPLPAAGVPSPFGLRLQLDRTFAYDPAAGPLLVDVVVHDQPPGAYSLDATYLCSSPFSAFGPPGCGAGGKALQVAVPTAQVLWGRPLQIEVREASPGAVTGLAFGSMESGVWNGAAIPFDLSPFGAPGCHIATDLLSIVAGTAGPTGVASHSFAVPAVPALQNEWVRFQALALDPTANPLGVVSSQGGKVQVCGWDPVARVYAPSATAAWGVRELGVAPVLEIAE